MIIIKQLISCRFSWHTIRDLLESKIWLVIWLSLQMLSHALCDLLLAYPVQKGCLCSLHLVYLEMLDLRPLFNSAKLHLADTAIEIGITRSDNSLILLQWLDAQHFFKFALFCLQLNVFRQLDARRSLSQVLLCGGLNEYFAHLLFWLFAIIILRFNYFVTVFNIHLLSIGVPEDI